MALLVLKKKILNQHLIAVSITSSVEFSGQVPVICGISPFPTEEAICMIKILPFLFPQKKDVLAQK